MSSVNGSGGLCMGMGCGFFERFDEFEGFDEVG
jgi:hypothetical protein